MERDIFQAIYLVGLTLIAVIRVYYRILTRDAQVVVDRKTIGEVVLMLQAAVGMLVVPLLFVLTPLLDVANYDLPDWTAWAGAFVLGAGIWLLWRSHAGLGRNFSSTLQLREGHALITDGPYRVVRHPMYAALWLIGAANALLLHNWIAGWSFLAGFGLLYVVRVPREERMMMQQFGEEYRAYAKETGRVLPRF